VQSTTLFTCPEFGDHYSHRVASFDPESKFSLRTFGCRWGVSCKRLL